MQEGEEEEALAMELQHPAVVNLDRRVFRPMGSVPEGGGQGCFPGGGAGAPSAGPPGSGPPGAGPSGSEPPDEDRPSQRAVNV